MEVVVKLSCSTSDQAPIKSSLSETITATARIDASDCRVTDVSVAAPGEFSKLLLAFLDANGKARVALQKQPDSACSLLAQPRRQCGPASRSQVRSRANPMPSAPALTAPVPPQARPQQTARHRQHHPAPRSHAPELPCAPAAATDAADWGACRVCRFSVEDQRLRRCDGRCARAESRFLSFY